ncbi:probable G-protein coupled receptor B0563.6 [Palaemon carinicauda]|uniref:probable G-protein coupled receptor B0563.6 n=1 Tax=Palaemon carinicauda TaxID=392227 RepID=UPI0035B5DC96
MICGKDDVMERGSPVGRLGDLMSVYHVSSKMISLHGNEMVSCNNSTETNPDLKQLRWIVYQVVFPVLVIVGVMANLLNLLVLSRPAMKGVSYRYLNHLAVSDLLYLLFNIPFCLEEFTKASQAQPMSKASAIYYAYIGIPTVNIFLSMSEYIVLWLSYDRCLAVCSPQKFSARQRLRVVRIRCAISLVVTLLVYSLSPFRQTYSCDGPNCCLKNNYFSEDTWYKGYEFFREFYSRFLPAFVITVFNVAIIVTLRRVKRERDSPDVINEARKERERRLVCLLMAITVFFYITSFPSAIYKIIMFNDSWDFVPYFRAVADVLEVSGHVFNFFLYFLFSPDYRRVLVGLTGQQQPNVYMSSSVCNI